MTEIGIANVLFYASTATRNRQPLSRLSHVMADQRPPLRELALFAGAGGGILGGQLLGWETVCAVEIEPYPASVLVARQNDGILPPFPIWDDIRTFDGRPWRGIIDVVSGGFPCQAYSTATRGRSVADDLWPEFLRVVADVAPWHVFAENVSRRAINKAAADLRALGYETKAISLGAYDLGADHIRSRYWLRAYANDKSELCSAVNAEMAIMSSVHCRVWDAFGGQPKLVDGVAHQLDEIKAIGNGQVPAVAAAAWRLLGGE